MAYTKRNLKSKKISELITDFFQQNNVENGQKNIDPLKTWVDVMGREIITETKTVNIESNILYVKIQNPYLKADLKSQTNQILKKIQLINPSIIQLVFN